MTQSELDLSTAIEALLVAENPRGMVEVRAALKPGYLLRAAQSLLNTAGPTGIITGFPVGDTVETDGPAGAQVLYETLQRLGRHPFIWTEAETLELCFSGYTAVPLPKKTDNPPAAIIVIERPGAARDGQFYNIRGEDISARCTAVEPLLAQLNCPVIAIGDGGNEVGMGKAETAVAALAIKGATQTCDELIVADVSNWAAYALASMLEAKANSPLTDPDIHQRLISLAEAGVVDGVTGQATATEDNFPADKGCSLAATIRGMLGATANASSTHSSTHPIQRTPS